MPQRDDRSDTEKFRAAVAAMPSADTVTLYITTDLIDAEAWRYGWRWWLEKMQEEHPGIKSIVFVNPSGLAVGGRVQH
jgi:hypothetical protein